MTRLDEQYTTLVAKSTSLVQNLAASPEVMEAVENAVLTEVLTGQSILPQRLASKLVTVGIAAVTQRFLENKAAESGTTLPGAAVHDLSTIARLYEELRETRRQAVVSETVLEVAMRKLGGVVTMTKDDFDGPGGQLGIFHDTESPTMYAFYLAPGEYAPTTDAELDAFLTARGVPHEGIDMSAVSFAGPGW